MIFGASLRTRGGKRDTSWIGYSEGSSPMTGGRCRQLAREFARSGFERGGAFRVIYVARLADIVYGLHAFQKRTRQTAKRDVDLAASRLREQMARMR